ncbi:50S ribosomal protein L28 [Sedimentisphaera cyanobacteriorum]|uniref:Large ribosomal subunit protein bL28 n=1 Tax=Sedimentisphaera cyanobacteriorum TaxID=1940790 RepID=A0A1Q2HMJ2_9BACT|nr:50S ribosomal protein L28 [Sedimentisphaera cyanobacteriorum]AQQ08495.1 50S ribosomal protein L28 [Sedimentisphaera cyanobacteriorum]
MSRKCQLTGRKTSVGRSIVRHGKPKRLGGVGLNIRGVNKRRFKPNTQKMRVMVDGQVKKITVSAKAVKSGLVVKPPKRRYNKAAQG